MKYSSCIFVFFLLIMSCKVFEPQRTCRTKLDFGKKIYYVSIPCDNVKHKELDDHRRINYKFYYNDETIFFANDEVDVTPNLVYRNMNERDVPSFVFYDSISVEGIDDRNQNTYWRVVKAKGLVLGYENVPESRKFEFDQALLTLTQKGTKDNSMSRDELLRHGN